MSISRKRTIIILSVVALFAVAAVGALSLLIKPAPYIDREAQIGNMEVIAAVLTDYRSDRGSFPEEEGGIDILFKEGYVGNSSFNIDLWGNALVYKGGGDQYLMYSLGENMMDEAGAGDDILICSQRSLSDKCRM